MSIFYMSSLIKHTVLKSEPLKDTARILKGRKTRSKGTEGEWKCQRAKTDERVAAMGENVEEIQERSYVANKQKCTRETEFIEKI